MDNWLGALRIAASSGRQTAVLDCAESMHWFSDRWIHGPHWHEVFTLGAQAAVALGDLAQHATQLNYLAWVQGIPLRSPETMLRYAAEALVLATRSGAAVQIAWAHHYSAIALRKLGRSPGAIPAASQAAGMFKALDDTDAYFACVSNLGHCLRDEGRHDEALERYREAFALVSDDDSGMTPSIAAHLRPYALADLGRCLGLLGRRGEAITTLTEATVVMESFDSNIMQALAPETLAALLDQDARIDESRRAYARAAEVFEVIGDAEAHSRCRALATTTP